MKSIAFTFGLAGVLLLIVGSVKVLMHPVTSADYLLIGITYLCIGSLLSFMAKANNPPTEPKDPTKPATI